MASRDWKIYELQPSQNLCLYNISNKTKPYLRQTKTNRADCACLPKMHMDFSKLIYKCRHILKAKKEKEKEKENRTSYNHFSDSLYNQVFWLLLSLEDFEAWLGLKENLNINWQCKAKSWKEMSITGNLFVYLLIYIYSFLHILCVTYSLFFLVNNW